MFLELLRILLKSRLPVLLGVCLGLVLLASVLAFLFGGRQPVTSSLDLGVSVLRLAMPFLIVFWVQDLVCREFERRIYCSSLSYPVSRAVWILGRFIVLCVVVLFGLLFVAVSLGLLVNFFSGQVVQGTPVSLGVPYIITLLFMAVDLLVLLSLALYLAVVASTPSFVLLGTLGFMLIARSYSSIVALLMSSSGLVSHEDTYRSGLGKLSYLFPDLGSLDIRVIALYGRLDLLPSDWCLSVASALTYALGFIALSVWAMQRKRMT